MTLAIVLVRGSRSLVWHGNDLKIYFKKLSLVIACCKVLSSCIRYAVVFSVILRCTSASLAWALISKLISQRFKARLKYGGGITSIVSPKRVILIQRLELVVK